MRRINRSPFFRQRNLAGSCGFALSLTGAWCDLPLSLGARRKSQVFENTVRAGQEACHNIHLNPSVGNQKMQCVERPNRMVLRGV
jgi:hypothetical protein